MRRFSFVLLTVTLLMLLVPAAGARSHKKKSTTAGQDISGQFDYYVLTLSWSPEYCAGPNGSRDPGQCGTERHFGFVVHGLWPQYEHGYPEACGTAAPVPDAIVNSMLPLMPSPKLIEHEWEKHGTCSGLDVNAYFQLIRKAFAAVQIPGDFKSPVKQVEIAPAVMKAKLEQANPSFPADALHLSCSGRYLSEARICFTKDLAARACSTDIRDTCRGDSIILRPMR